MQRQPRPQDIDWFLELNKKGQLDLNPPYQRKSVWTKKDREHFIDTVFHDYPSPAIFLHKTADDSGTPAYHVVDGKQRLETIIAFSQDMFRIPESFGDDRLNGKKFSELDVEFKQLFWNYSLSVEFLPFVDESFLNSVFERINRNSRKLTDQELRHARFDGWLIKFVENQIADEDWTAIGVVTKARSRRMGDAQFLSELLMTTITGQVRGFDQRQIDDFYALYDDPDANALLQTTDEIEGKFSQIKFKLRKMIEADDRIKTHLKALANIYTLWGALAAPELEDKAPEEIIPAYIDFMTLVQNFQNNPLRVVPQDPPAIRDRENDAKIYALNLTGASTDEAPRKLRHEILLRVLTV